MLSFLHKIDRYFSRVFYHIESQGFLWTLVTVCTLLVAFLPLMFLFDLTMFSNVYHTPSMVFQTNLYNNLLLYSHIAFSFPALMIGPWMFHSTLRQNNLKLHRFLGKIYVIGCAYGALTVYPLAVHNQVAPLAHIGFGSMAVIWFLTTYFAYMAARHKNWVTHRRWMMRSYAMTFAFVHVNLTFKFFLDYETMNPYTMRALQSMVSWQSNLLLVELYIAATSHQGQFLGWAGFKKNLTKRFNTLDRFYWKVPVPKAKA